MESNINIENIESSIDNTDHIILSSHLLTNQSTSSSDYFDKQDPEEESIINTDSNMNSKYFQLEQLYNTIVPLDCYEAAKKKSLSEQVRLRVKTDKNKTFNYGEMTFRTMAYVFEVIRHTFGQDAIRQGDFYDLGSGHGNVCAQVALIYPFLNIYGVEILSPLHKMALKTKSRYDHNIRKFVSDNSGTFTQHKDTLPEITFVKGSLFDADFSKASVVYSNSTLFSDEIYKHIFNKVQELPAGSIHINICDYMPDEFVKNWDCVNPFSRLMSWGTSEILIYRKK